MPGSAAGAGPIRRWSWSATTRRPAAAAPPAGSASCSSAETPTTRVWRRAVEIGADDVFVLPRRRKQARDRIDAAEGRQAGPDRRRHRRARRARGLDPRPRPRARRRAGRAAHPARRRRPSAEASTCCSAGSGPKGVAGPTSPPRRAGVAGGPWRSRCRRWGLRVLSWDRATRWSYPPAAMWAVGARRGPQARRSGRGRPAPPGRRAVVEALAQLDLGSLLVPGELRGPSPPRTGWPPRSGWSCGTCARWSAGRTRPPDELRIADALRLPLAGELPTIRALRGPATATPPPGADARGGLGRFCTAFWERVLRRSAPHDRGDPPLDAAALRSPRAAPTRRPLGQAAALRPGPAPRRRRSAGCGGRSCAVTGRHGPAGAAARRSAGHRWLVPGPPTGCGPTGRGLEPTGVTFSTRAVVRRSQRLAPAGRRLDDARPWVDARPPDGTRMHAVLPPVAVGSTCLSLRWCGRGPSPWRSSRGGHRPAGRRAAATGAGRGPVSFRQRRHRISKTTLLLSTLPAWSHERERIVIAEDSAELPDHPHVVRFREARPPNQEGAGA